MQAVGGQPDLAGFFFEGVGFIRLPPWEEVYLGTAWTLKPGKFLIAQAVTIVASGEGNPAGVVGVEQNCLGVLSIKGNCVVCVEGQWRTTNRYLGVARKLDENCLSGFWRKVENLRSQATSVALDRLNLKALDPKVVMFSVMPAVQECLYHRFITTKRGLLRNTDYLIEMRRRTNTVEQRDEVMFRAVCALQVIRNQQEGSPFAKPWGNLLIPGLRIARRRTRVETSLPAG